MISVMVSVFYYQSLKTMTNVLYLNVNVHIERGESVYGSFR